jgi:hypothetical protein
VFHPALFAGISDLSLDQVAEGHFVSALHDYMHSRADSHAANLRLVPAKRKKSPGAVAGASSQGSSNQISSSG